MRRDTGLSQGCVAVERILLEQDASRLESESAEMKVEQHMAALLDIVSSHIEHHVDTGLCDFRFGYASSLCYGSPVEADRLHSTS